MKQFIEENKGLFIIIVLFFVFDTAHTVFEYFGRSSRLNSIRNIEKRLNILSDSINAIEFQDNTYDSIAANRLLILDSIIQESNQKILEIELKNIKYEKAIKNLEDSLRVNGINIIDLPDF